MTKINEHLDVNIKNSLKEIYTNVFCGIEEQYIIVFLCGGASTKGKKSLRDKMRPMLENDKKKYLGQLPIKVFYPEDLLIDVLNKTKNADLLSYEQFLADNSHIIAIICESAGSLVELGAFTNNEYTVNKVIAAVEKKRVKDKSFIMLGPIKYLKRKNKLSVVEYTSDEYMFARNLLKSIREKYSKDGNNKKIRLDTIVGLSYFIQILLYYFKRINSKTLANMIQTVVETENMKIENFNLLFSAALKLLFYDKQIVKMANQRFAVYELTQSGHESIEKVISRCTSHKICDMIRIKIMYYDLYKSSHP